LEVVEPVGVVIPDDEPHRTAEGDESQESEEGIERAATAAAAAASAGAGGDLEFDLAPRRGFGDGDEAAGEAPAVCVGEGD